MRPWNDSWALLNQKNSVGVMPDEIPPAESSDQTIRETLCSIINKVRTDSGREQMELLDEHQLTGEIELDSLDLAQLVVAIEKELGVDPFRDGSATARTLGELVAVYRQAIQ